MPLPVALKNTDKTLWEDAEGMNRVFITQDGQAVGLCCAGKCVVKPLREWVTLGWGNPPEAPSVADRIADLENAVHELNPGWLPAR